MKEENYLTKEVLVCCKEDSDGNSAGVYQIWC